MASEAELLASAQYFVGVVVVQVRPDAFTTNQYNEVWSGAATSEDAARGAWIKASLAKHPGGSIVYQGIWNHTASVLEYARARAATIGRQR